MAAGRLRIEDGVIAAVELDDGLERDSGSELPYIAPGFVDVHVHGGGGFDAMGGPEALDGMARHLRRHGVTSFLPTAVAAPLEIAQAVRGRRPGVDASGHGGRRATIWVQPRRPVSRHPIAVARTTLAISARRPRWIARAWSRCSSGFG